ncbi:MAG: 3'(2'),5'-bisphosphate nucleotidase CysQ [Asticcacaulis sp.]
MTQTDSTTLLNPADIGLTLADIAEAAAKVILPYWRSDLSVGTKSDDSPVTEADKAAEALILERLSEAFPGVLVISEEAAEHNGLPDGVPAQFFLVDPLDGTRGFVRGAESFTVNIGLIHNGVPVAGVVVAPATGLTWFTHGGKALRRRFGERDGHEIKVRSMPAGQGLALVSHTLTDADATRQAARCGCPHWQAMDSSIKFCLIAEGRADAYPRPGPTKEWDTAAADALLRAAGGRVLVEGNATLTYGKADKGFLNPGFLAVGG